MKKDIHPPHSQVFVNRGNIGIFVLVPLGILALLSRPLIPLEGLTGFIFSSLAHIFFILYLFFRAWATLYLGGRKNVQLQTEGPYSLTRNPLYFGSLCFGLSAAFFLHSLLMMAGLAVVGILYLRGVVADEEQVLEKVFGKKFRDYKARTPALIPAPALYRGSAEIRVLTGPLFQELKRLAAGSLLPILAGFLNNHRPGLFPLP